MAFDENRVLDELLVIVGRRLCRRVLLEKGAISDAEHQDCYASLESGVADSTLIAGWLGQFIVDNAGRERG